MSHDMGKLLLVVPYEINLIEFHSTKCKEAIAKSKEAAVAGKQKIANKEAEIATFEAVNAAKCGLFLARDLKLILDYCKSQGVEVKI